MDITAWFDINNTLWMIPIGSGYELSWIEAIGTIAGLLCIWLASQEKTINYLFGLINVTLFAIIFYQIQLYSLLMLQLFFFCANIYGWYAWTRPQQNGDPLQIHWLSTPKLVGSTLFSIAGIAWLTAYSYEIFVALASMTITTLNALGASLTMPTIAASAHPFWDACATILSIVAQILMTRKYVESWWLWTLINAISIGLYAAQGVYAMSIQYSILLFIAANGIREWSKAAAQPHRADATPNNC